jgi:hypothetical protein
MEYIAMGVLHDSRPSTRRRRGDRGDVSQPDTEAGLYSTSWHDLRYTAHDLGSMGTCHRLVRVDRLVPNTKPAHDRLHVDIVQ